MEGGDGELGALWGRSELGRSRLVEDIVPGAAGPRSFPQPEDLVSFRGRLFFTLNYDDGRKELWRSNATEEGTFRVMEFPPVRLPSGGLELLAGLTPVGSRLFFAVGDDAHGTELWVSDGTREGTRLVADLTPGPEGSRLGGLTAVGRTLYFFRVLGGGGEEERTELWKSDGTAEGTVRVRDFGPDTSSTFELAVVGETLFFSLSDPEHGNELWRSNGTAGGTRLVEDISPGPGSSAPRSLSVAGHRVYFVAEDPEHGDELWESDGTRAGTRLVADLEPGPASSLLWLMDVANGQFFFGKAEFAERTVDLYALSVGSSSPRLVERLPNPYLDEPDTAPYITAFATTGRKLFFALPFISSAGPAPRDHQLWVTDGTRAGTRQVYSPLSLADEFVTELFPIDEERILLPADDEGETELWVSNGTRRGTRRLHDIAPGPTSSYPHGFTRVNDCIFFVAFDPEHGSELRVLKLR